MRPLCGSGAILPDAAHLTRRRAAKTWQSGYNSRILRTINKFDFLNGGVAELVDAADLKSAG
jgi:hypothetical protein